MRPPNRRSLILRAGKVLVCEFVLLIGLVPSLLADQPAASPTPLPEFEFNTTVFMSTFKLFEPVNHGTCGSSFLLVKPKTPGAREGWWVLVTAAHLLEGIMGDQAVLVTRSHAGDVWTRAPYTFHVRKAGKPLWVKHPTADVAAMYLSLPDALKPPGGISTELLATDELLDKYDVHPGDELFALGFPFCEEGDFGFPVLRSGALASFPLVPSRSIHAFLFDFSVFEGNSGSPVYLYSPNRTVHGNRSSQTVQMIMGLVSAQSMEPSQSATVAPTGTGALFAKSPAAAATKILPGTTRSSLALAVIVPSTLISDTINRLPQTPPAP